jgi:hypothetical protein
VGLGPISVVRRRSSFDASVRHKHAGLLARCLKKMTPMSALKKQRVVFEIYADSYEMLRDIAERYQLPDASKALRCLLDYAATDGDWDEIFKKIRCRRCG